MIPSATDLQLGSQRWSAGPAAVAVYTRGALVVGILANNIWSFAGNGGQPVNAMLIQPFININLANGWCIASSPSEVVQLSVLLDTNAAAAFGASRCGLFRPGAASLPASIVGILNVVLRQNPERNLLRGQGWRGQFGGL